MSAMEQVLFYLTFAGYGLASVLYIIYLILKNKLASDCASAVTLVTVLFNAAALVLRWVIAGRVPLSNAYEFLLAFSFGIAVMFLYTQRSYKLAAAGAFVIPVAWLILAWVSMNLSPEQRSVAPLMPALQSKWLVYHVTTAIFSYGAFAVAFGLGILYLWKKRTLRTLAQGSTNSWSSLLPEPERLDEMSYRMIAFGFPLLTLCIITGAIWADYAWGRYWSWDPKETWSLITWLIYAAYLHARLTYGWKGSRAAGMAILGFVAVLFTFFGVNYFLTGLHSYQ